MMKHRLLLALAAAAFASGSAAQPFDPGPWLADLEQAREAFHSRYSNRAWLETEREVELDALFDDSAKRMRNARDERQAKAVFDRLVRRVADGHVRIDWPEEPRSGSPTAASAAPADLCSAIGYDERQNAPGTAHALPDYRPLPTAGNPFAAGTVDAAGTRVGVVRIGVFMPHGYPLLCREAVQALAIPVDKPCDDECQNRIVTFAYRRMGEALEQRLSQLKEAGAQLLLVDISNNGGGSEWAEAAARMLSPKLLVSEQLGFVRGEHWAKQWRGLAERLRGYAAKASPEDRQRLLAWASEADSAAKEAESPCASTDSECSNVASAGYPTGLVGGAPSGSFDGKEWAVHVFNPAQHHYRDGTWSGPVIVLVNDETWSAAEQFAAVLQDNRVAVVLGSRTGGAGCGYTWGGHPTTLKNSGAILRLPDCVRYRADGSNEVRGIIPDELVATRATDGAALRGRMVAERLPAAIARATALYRAD